MVATLDGKKIAEEIYKNLSVQIVKMTKKPKLVVVLLGEDAASRAYVGQKEKAAKEIGVDFELIKKPENFNQSEMEKLLDSLNKEDSITGVVVQKPLPPQIDSDRVDLLVKPEKDVDGLNPASPFLPATTRGVFELLSAYQRPVKGRDVVVVGKSKLTGLPTALEFLKRGATVTICHSETENLAEKTKQADILVSAAGEPGLIKADMVKKNAVVIDIGFNQVNGKIVGDVDFESVSKIASYIS